MIDLDFDLWDHNEGSIIDIYTTEYDQGLVIGETFLWNTWFDIDIRILEDEWQNYMTIIHEIGHALGLSHPNNDVYDSNFSVSDK